MTSPETPPTGTARPWIPVRPTGSVEAEEYDDAPDERPEDADADHPAFPAPAVDQTPVPEPHRERLLVALLGERRLRLGSTARDRLWAWLGPLLVTVVAAVARLWDLGRPHTLVFDETYYVKQAYTLLMVGYDAEWPEEPNPAFEAGNRDIFLDKADYVVHPPVGKWMIAAGMRLGGADNPWAWRLTTALVGIAAVFLVAWVARRLFASTLAGIIAGGLFAIDGVGIVHARTGLLDSMVMFWALVAFVLLILDREHSRRRLAARVGARLDAGLPLGRFGPSMGIRWYRLAAAVALGLCIGTKWSGLYFLAVFALMSVAWDASARRTVGIRMWPLAALVRDAIPAFFVVVPVAALTYLASWAAWFTNDRSYLRTWAADHPTAGVQWLPEALRSLWEYHGRMWRFHNGLTSDHTYEAHPLGWLVQWRPTSFYYESQAKGEAIPTGGVCAWEKCSQVITSVGNPLIWWLATAAILLALVLIGARLDWRGIAVLSGIVAGWLPWLAYAQRTIFTFYTIAFAPFMYLTLTYVAVSLWELTADHPRRRKRLRTAGIVVGSLVVAFSLFWYPIWTGWNVPTGFWRAHMWLRSWI